MNIQTKFHDEITIAEEQIIHFEKGLPGFEDEKKFVLLDLNDEGSIKLLQSTTTTHVAFFVVNPFSFVMDYEFSVDEASKLELELDETKESVIQVLSILTARDPFNQSTINLQGPVVINLLNNKAKQLILNNLHLSIRHPLLQAMESKK